MSKGGGGVNIPNNYTIALGSTNTPLQVDVDLENVAPITVNSNLAITKPIVTQSTSTSNSTGSVDLKVEPLTVDSDSKSQIDLKPVVVDSCQTIRIAPLPPIHMEQPYSTHFGITYMGTELWGFTMSGSSEMRLHSPGKAHPCGAEPCADETASPVSAAPSATEKTRRRSGLRVRVSDNS